MEYKLIEIPVNGKKVRAYFPIEADSKIMPLVKEVLISAYLSDMDEKNVWHSFCSKQQKIERNG